MRRIGPREQRVDGVRAPCPVPRGIFPVATPHRRSGGEGPAASLALCLFVSRQSLPDQASVLSGPCVFDSHESVGNATATKIRRRIRRNTRDGLPVARPERKLRQRQQHA